MNTKEMVEEFLEKAKSRNTPIKVLVAGSRSFSDYIFFKKIMYDLLQNFPDTELVSGKASSGPDMMAIEYAKEVGLICHEFPANWNDIGVPNVRIKVNGKGRQYNANAGHDRNQIMAEFADFFIIFWDGKSPGTRDMINRAKKHIKYGVIFKIEDVD